MTDEIISRQMEARKVVIKLVDGSLVKGKINLHHGEQMVQRVSEMFTEVENPFVVVFEATFEGRGDRVVIINKRNILWVSPDD